MADAEEPEKQQLALLFEKLVRRTSNLKGRPPIHSAQSEVSDHLGPDLRHKLKLLEHSFDEMWKLYDAAEVAKIELPGVYVLRGCLKNI